MPAPSPAAPERYISPMHRLASLAAVVAVFVAAACIDRDTAQKAIESIQASEAPPDDLPVMLNAQLPFHYPPPLFAARVQGNVLLRIHIDSTGAVWPESTSVLQTSGYPGLDTAALVGARQLRFSPARAKGRPIAVSLNLPVYFRHPGQPPLPGDSILHRKASAGPTP